MTEGSASNIFAVVDGVLVSLAPATDTDAAPVPTSGGIVVALPRTNSFVLAGASLESAEFESGEAAQLADLEPGDFQPPARDTAAIDGSAADLHVTFDRPWSNGLKLLTTGGSLSHVWPPSVVILRNARPSRL